LLQALADKATPPAADGGEKGKPPTLILSIDQGEELFLVEAQDEAKAFLALLRDLVTDDAPALIAVFTIRSDNYERLQLAAELLGMRQDIFSLAPMPRGSYAEVVKGPARRLEATPRALTIDEGLVDALLADIEAGGAKDALPLLAFILERLYAEYHAGGVLKLSQYDALGRVRGSIEAAVGRALKAADADPAIPRDRTARLALLRRGLIPWLAGIDPDTGAPRRRVARLSEIPAEARPLIQHLVEQRLLATDVNRDTGEATIEPAHEALLRQWSLLDGWLTEDATLLAVLEGVKRQPRLGREQPQPRLVGAPDRPAGCRRAARQPGADGSELHRRLPQGRGGRQARPAPPANRDLRIPDHCHHWPHRLDQTGLPQSAVALVRRDSSVHGREGPTVCAQCDRRTGAQAKGFFQGVRKRRR
jgi:hypothetical protein